MEKTNMKGPSMTRNGVLTHTVTSDCQFANFISNVAPCWLWK